MKLGGIKLKIIIQALIGSIIIHVTYIFGTLLIGYIKTKFYKPDISTSWDNVEILQNEVAFGRVISPYFALLSFVGVAVICGIILFIYKK